MPALPDYPLVLKLRHHFEIGTDFAAVVIWHLSYSGTAPSDATCVTIAGDILGHAATRFAPLMAIETSLIGVDVTDLTSPTSGFGDSAGVTVGTRAGGLLPAQTAVLVNQPFPRRYRGGKSKTYWPFLTDLDLDSPQEWSSSAVAAVQGALESYLGDLEGISVSGTAITGLVSISYYEGFTAVTNPVTGRTRDVPKVRTAAIAPDVISALNVSAIVSTQRRRARPR